MISGIADLNIARLWVLGFLILIIPYMFLRLRILSRDAVDYAPTQFMQRSSSKLAWWICRPILEVLILCLSILALSGVYSESERDIIKAKGIDIALALDVSATMMAADFPPNRLESLKKISADFIKRSGSNRIAVYIFAKDVFTQTPLTTDHAVLLDLLEGVAYEIIDHSKSGGTAIGDALLYAAEGLSRNKIKKRDQVIILITDGENNSGIEPIPAAKYVRSQDIRLYVVGIGGEKPVPVFINGKKLSGLTSLDDTQLQNIAGAARGKYFRAKSAGVLSEIFSELSRLEKSPLEIKSLRTRKYFTPHLALPIFFCFFAWLGLTGFVLRRPLK